MDQKDAEGLRISELEAKMESIEMERAALLSEIYLSLSSQDRREEAFAQRDALLTEWINLHEELRILRSLKAS